MNNKQKLITSLLRALQNKPMNRQEMADYLHVSVVFISKYITELRQKKMIYICRYERTPYGKPKSYYAVGDLPDVPTLKPIPAKILQKKYREMNKRQLVPRKIVPRMDIAASWMLNPC